MLSLEPRDSLVVGDPATSDRLKLLNTYHTVVANHTVHITRRRQNYIASRIRYYVSICSQRNCASTARDWQQINRWSGDDSTPWPTRSNARKMVIVVVEQDRRAVRNARIGGDDPILHDRTFS